MGSSTFSKLCASILYINRGFIRFQFHYEVKRSERLYRKMTMKIFHYDFSQVPQSSIWKRIGFFFQGKIIELFICFAACDTNFHWFITRQCWNIQWNVCCVFSSYHFRYAFERYDENNWEYGDQWISESYSIGWKWRSNYGSDNESVGSWCWPGRPGGLFRLTLAFALMLPT